MNHQMLKEYVGRTVSLVGKVESRGQVWRLQAADGLPVNVTVLEDAKPIDKPDGTCKADDTCVCLLSFCLALFSPAHFVGLRVGVGPAHLGAPLPSRTHHRCGG